MAWQTPTLVALIDRARQAFRAELPGSDAWIWPNNISVTAKVLAGAVYELFGRLDWRLGQLFASTAEGEWIDWHAYELGLARRAAMPASGTVVFTATAAFSMDAGTVLISTAGQEFTLDAAIALDGPGTVEATALAVSDGAAGNLAAGTALTIAGSPSGVMAEVGGDGFTSGSDLEDDESLRDRVLFRKRNAPHGGAPADYVGWCKEVSGVTRVFLERLWDGPGTVRVFVLMDGLYANGIPTAADLVRVRTHLETVIPASAGLTVAAPVAVPLTITIAGLDPDNTDVREAIAAELTSMLLRRARVAGTDTGNAAMPYLATPFILSRSWVAQAISEAGDELSHVLTAPATDISYAAGQIPVLGTISYA